MTALAEMPISVLAAAPSISSQLLGSLLIGLREGLEAAIVVSILLAFLVKSERRDALKWVWLGVGSAILLTVGVFVGIQFGENTITGLAAEAIAGVASLIAVAIVTTMVLWMKKAAASLSGELRSEMSRALETGGWAVATLAFLAVGREGVETALFMVGYAEAETLWPLTGLIIGVVIAAAIAYGMYAGAVRINLAKFFKYTGALLIVVAAGILSYGIGALQTVGWLPGLSSRAFDISSWFDWSAWYGEVIQGVFNVTPTPTVLQLVGWLAYLVIVLALFLRPSPGKPARRSNDSTASEPPTADPDPDSEPTSESERSSK
ncbi:iron transporter [Mycobacterium sp. MS1601]|uniref:iron uptake transporter permease EfeU n=1 Tax=Mycobacterium sp. MS1601 TaxID=1936029 RepID=UPI00097978E6|nr:iron uptake transporter permease EfeU [Mycobacterium sp. MS1601]AQA03882.1 iron transporter [Mycobacterium sp. MS1601]